MFTDSDEEIAEGLVLQEATITQLQKAMEKGELTAETLTMRYLERIERIDRQGPALNSVIEVNPEALKIAEQLDRERQKGASRGLLHGIPILLKDNLDTQDRMQTIAGSLALVGQPALRDATVVARLRQAGAVILGKTNMSEWANFRSPNSLSGWSARGGQCRNPYALDRNPSGSSSGSAVSVSANLCSVSIGTDTYSSILSPASACGVVGIRPTVGLTSRTGAIPLAHTRDTVGPIARSVADAAIVLGALGGIDSRDPATPAGRGKSFSDYTQFLTVDGLSGARIGISRTGGWGINPKVDAIMEEAIRAIKEAGATVVDSIDISLRNQPAGDAQTTVFLHEFKHGLNAYLKSRAGIPVGSLAELMEFNSEHAAEEMPWFGQEWFEQAEKTAGLSDPQYLEALAREKHLSQQEKAVLEGSHLDALIAPTCVPAWANDIVNGDPWMVNSYDSAVRAGHPAVTVPAGFIFGLRVNISFIGRAWSDPTLVRLAFAFEQYTQVRQQPKFLPSWSWLEGSSVTENK